MVINYKKLKKYIHKTSTGYRFDYRKQGIETILFKGSKNKLIKLISYLIHTYPEYQKEFTLYNKPHYTSKLARNYYKHISTGKPSKYFRP